MVQSQSLSRSSRVAVGSVVTVSLTVAESGPVPDDSATVYVVSVDGYVTLWAMRDGRRVPLGTFNSAVAPSCYALDGAALGLAAHGQTFTLLANESSDSFRDVLDSLTGVYR